MNEKYTGREIAIFTDVHGLLEPMEALINDIERRGIREIYSLGDNIGFGPSPCEVVDILECYNIKSVAGNAEEYYTLGVEPYLIYFDSEKLMNQMWTKSKLGDRRLSYIRNFLHSFDLIIGGKKVALCHFANDVRVDYGLNGAEKYLYNLNSGEAYKQFLYTNSEEQIRTINYNIDKYGFNNPRMRGYVSAREYPIFDGKRVDYYDAIIEGHMHRNLYEKGGNTEFYSFRAVGLHFDTDPIDLAFYVILREKTNNMGFDIERVYVPFDRGAMEETISRCDGPTGKIRGMVRMK